MSEKPTAGPWTLEWDDNEHRSAKLVNSKGQTVLDTLNSEVACVYTEHDPMDGSYDKFDGQGLVDLTLVARLANLYFAGQKLADDAEAATRAAGDLPPDLDYGLTETEIAAAKMLNALQTENQQLLEHFKQFLSATDNGTQQCAEDAFDDAMEFICKVEGREWKRQAAKAENEATQ